MHFQHFRSLQVLEIEKITVTDYYSFGAPMPGRSYVGSNDYRYGAANGQEKVDEISGLGNHYTADFWEYDPRLAKRWNVDPIVKPWRSPYDAYDNSPIWRVDPNGADDTEYKTEKGETITKTNDGIDKTVIIADDKREEFDINLKAAEEAGVRDYAPTNERLARDYGLHGKAEKHVLLNWQYIQRDKHNAAMNGVAGVRMVRDLSGQLQRTVGAGLAIGYAASPIIAYGAVSAPAALSTVSAESLLLQQEMYAYANGLYGVASRAVIESTMSALIKNLPKQVVNSAAFGKFFEYMVKNAYQNRDILKDANKLYKKFKEFEKTLGD